MQPDRMTIKTREALQSASESARRAGHPELTPAHFVKALLEQDAGLFSEFLTRVGVDGSQVDAAVERELKKLPKVEGGDLNVSRDFQRLLDSATRDMEKRKDAYLSTEHVIAALAGGAGGEIGAAMKRLGITPAKVDEEFVARHLYTNGLPDPDLLIRTSGEMRLSNFMLWQLAYTELWITETLWPDFRRAHLFQAVADYQRRERRFGRVD
jgi:ATP-dependent Clp protease ATP-binding subunit ClpA